MILKNYNIFKESKIDNIQRPWIFEGDFYVTKDMVLNGKLIKDQIPNVINGHFTISEKRLTSLEGCPEEVNGTFDCTNNELTSLEGCPFTVNGNFYCSNNKLTTLNGSPNKINRGFYCSNNQLTSLEGSPILISKLIKQIICIYNKLDLTIEKEFIQSNKYTIQEAYYQELLQYMIEEKIDLDKITTWPKGFLTDEVIASAKGLTKFNL